MEVRTVGIDLGKSVFHLVGVTAAGEVVLRKRFSRDALLRFTANLKVVRIGMEACSGAHFLGRALQAQGHDVRLMPAQYVKPYVITNKNDYIDAEAIAEAVWRPKTRFVPVKTDDQLDMQSLHRARQGWVDRRTALVNQIRGLLLERGITIPKGRRKLEEALPSMLEDADVKLSALMRILLAQLQNELKQLQAQIAQAEAVISKGASEHEACQRLMGIPGIGPITATAIIAAIGNGASFQKGRGFAAWLGLVPSQYSTGGKQKLLGISKRGNCYIRTLLVHGARAVLQFKHLQPPGLSSWLDKLMARAHHNLAVVALANKLARMAWAVLSKGEAYRPPQLEASAV